jgi:type IV conjugative transfer system protein TraE
MKPSKLISAVAAAANLRSFIVVLFAVSVVGNTASGLAWLIHGNKVRTVLTPPEIRREMWVDESEVSDAYLQEMGDYIIGKYANFTPASFGYQSEVILRHAHPDSYGELQVQFKQALNDIKARNLSSSFAPQAYQVLKGKMMVTITGAVTLSIADKRLVAEQKCFLVAFTYTGGKTQIKEIRETDLLHPFDAPKKAL